MDGNGSGLVLDDQPEKKETFLGCGLAVATENGPQECGKPAEVKVKVGLFGVALVDDLHLCPEHHQLFRTNGIQVNIVPLRQVILASELMTPTPPAQA